MASKKWPLEEIEAMRAELDANSTFAEVGARRGISGERVRQLTGNTGRSRAWRKIQKRQQDSEIVAKLYAEGAIDSEVANQTGLKKRRVRSIRSGLGLKANLRHSPERTIRLAKQWFADYGYTPGVGDWNPVEAEKMGHSERVKRLKEFSAKYGKPPTYKDIVRLFGSQSEMVRQAGLPSVPLGKKALGRFKVKKP